MTPEQLAADLRAKVALIKPHMLPSHSFTIDATDAIALIDRIDSQAKEIERLKAELNYAKEELHGMLCNIPDPGIPHQMGELRDRLAKAAD